MADAMKPESGRCAAVAAGLQVYWRLTFFSRQQFIEFVAFALFVPVRFLT